MSLKLNINYKSLGKRVLHFLLLKAAFFVLFSVLLIYYGPFNNIRDYVVSTSMNTNGYKFLSTVFLSRNQINSILSRTNSVVMNGTENPAAVVVTTDNHIATMHPSPSNSPAANASAAATGQAGNSVSKADAGAKTIDISGPHLKGKLIEIADPSRVVLGLAPQLGRVGAPLSEIVGYNHAAGGINAGGFLDDNLLGTGSNPDGIVVQNGQVQFMQKGLSSFNVIGFNSNDVLVVSNSMTLDEIKKSNLRCAVSFGPSLIVNGQPLVIKGGTSLQPRSAIGQKKDGTVLLLAIDGRQQTSMGANFLDVQNILLQYGAYNAANLDGGSSTTMNFQGSTMNVPCDITGERSIATAFLVLGKGG
jgi:exopolysaccharide biosynthesis protein